MAFIRHPKDFFAGLIFIAFGLAAIIIGSNYSLGSAARMGPGYFPRILGILLLVLGAALCPCAPSRSRAIRFRAWHWRPMLIVLGSVIAFGVLVNYIGLVLATIGLVFCSSAASHEFRPREALVSGVLLAALAVGVFIYRPEPPAADLALVQLSAQWT